MTLYKGRIGAKPSELMDAINRSLPVDIRLLPYDAAVNRAWAGELHRLGVYTADELFAVQQTLEELVEAYAQNAFDPLPDDEDVHTLIERLLSEKLGETGARIHTGRSRNDQVATDLRLYVLDELTKLDEEIRALVAMLADKAAVNTDTLLAGSTHLQPAQPITLAHFLLSAAFGLKRDAQRLVDARKRALLCPLGSGALAGAGFAVDRHKLAYDLGFDGPTANTLDAISDRDVAQETACAVAVMLTRLSRYAEQFVIWASPNFGYVRFADDWSTGSSMMPQKRNPDAMELVRAKAARAIGQANALLTLTKGLPLSYAKDLQEDKIALFDTLDTAHLTVNVFREAAYSADFNAARMRNALSGDLLATDLADLLVESGVPFRRAHERVGQFVTTLEAGNRSLLDADEQEFQTEFPELRDVKSQLSFANAVARRNVAGGPAPECVAEQIAELKKWLTPS